METIRVPKNQEMSWDALRASYPDFVFRATNVTWTEQELILEWHFVVPGLTEFRPTLRLPRAGMCFGPDSVPEEQAAIYELAVAVGMVELISYWKATASPRVHLPLHIPAVGEELDFWLNLYRDGMGEYFYLNNIPVYGLSFMEPTALAEEPATVDVAVTRSVVEAGDAAVEPDIGVARDIAAVRNRLLLPLGGGKDSLVSLAVARRTDKEIVPFAINPQPATLEAVAAAGLAPEECIFVRRSLDQRLLRLNELGFLNGHTPFSALVALTARMVAYLYGLRDIALSNEASANEPTVDLPAADGRPINHQYSKTLEFEQAVAGYFMRNQLLEREVRYFSLLRPYSELAIARAFTELTDYHHIFRSCNRGSKNNVWCGHCAKCLFVSLIMLPWLGRDKVAAMIGRDLIEAEDMVPILAELLGVTPTKPFECVGTRVECYLALELTRAEYGRSYDTLPLLLRQFVQWQVNGELPAELSERTVEEHYQELLYTAHPHRVPAEYFPALSSLFPPLDLADVTSELPGWLRVLREHFYGKSVALLGLGREGKSSLNILSKWRHDIGWERLLLADRAPQDKDELCEYYDLQAERAVGRVVFFGGEDYCLALDEADIVVKSPGIALLPWSGDLLPNGRMRRWPNCAITCQTDLFMQAAPGLTVGVSGTKGKSTTTALIHDLLAAQREPSYLLGNIGVPVFEDWTNLEAEDAVALELSSHQLQFMRNVPWIAVLTNLYPEHLDHYASYEAYVDAKLNLLRYQSASDVAIIDLDNTELARRAAKLVRGEVILVSHSAVVLTAGIRPGNLAALGWQGKEPLATIWVNKPRAGDALHLVWRMTGDEAGRIATSADSATVFSMILPRESELRLDNLGSYLRGVHHATDMALAWAVAQLAGLPAWRTKEVFASFRGLAHRTEYCGEFAGRHFVNDSIATIPEATILALETLAPVHTLIAGGMDRGLDLSALADCIVEQAVPAVILLPDTGRVLAELLRKRLGTNAEAEVVDEGSGTRVFVVEDMRTAVSAAFAETPIGGTVLLSPAASSYNRYKSFEERGEDFRAEILKQAKNYQ